MPINWYYTPILWGLKSRITGPRSTLLENKDCPYEAKILTNRRQSGNWGKNCTCSRWKQTEDVSKSVCEWVKEIQAMSLKILMYIQAGLAYLHRRTQQVSYHALISEHWHMKNLIYKNIWKMLKIGSRTQQSSHIYLPFFKLIIYWVECSLYRVQFVHWLCLRQK